MTRLMQEHLLRAKLERAPLARPKVKVEALPEVSAPDVADLAVDVPLPPPVTEAMLMTAAAELARAHGEVVVRQSGAPIEADDEILVDLVAYANGRVVPGSAKSQVWLTPDDEPALPGLRAVLLGQTIGKSLWAKVKYPEDAPLEAFAKQQLVYAVDVLAARAVTPVELDAPSLLAAAGVEDVDGLLSVVAQSLEAEREQAALAFAQLAVADAVQARLGPVAIPAAILDAELDHRWSETEGALLRDKGLSVDDLAYARAAFVDDPARRAELEHGLRVTMALGALAVAHDLRPAREDLDARLEQLAALQERPVDEIVDEIKADTGAHASLGQALLLERAFEWVMARATVRWVESEPEPAPP